MLAADPNDSLYIKQQVKLAPLDRPKVTSIDSRNFNDQMIANLNKNANECDYVVFKSDYSTMGTPGKLHAPKLDDKFNTLKYISTYGCIWSLSMSFWFKTSNNEYTCTNYQFCLYPGERCTINAKNREYLQKSGLDFNKHALFGLRYVPGQPKIGLHGIQYLFSSILCTLSNRNVNIYCFNGINELACLYNALYVELPDELYMWCKDLSYFNIIDIKPFYVDVLNVKNRNYLIRLFGLEQQSNAIQVTCEYNDTQLADTDPNYAVKLEFTTMHGTNTNASDFPLFCPLTHFYPNMDIPRAYDYMNRTIALKQIPFATGQSHFIDISPFSNFNKSTPETNAFGEMTPNFTPNEIQILNAAAIGPSYANITENLKHSIYDQPSWEKGFQIGYMVASLQQKYPEHQMALQHKKLQLLGRNGTMPILDLEAEHVNNCKHGNYHLMVISGQQNKESGKERRKDIGVKQFTNNEQGIAPRGRGVRGRRGRGGIRGQRGQRGVRGRGVMRGQRGGATRGRGGRGMQSGRRMAYRPY